MFSNLSYFKCAAGSLDMHCMQRPAAHRSPNRITRLCSPCHMFRFGVAHIILLGLLKDFWAQWLPSTKAKAKPRPAGPVSHFMLPLDVRKAISERRQFVMLTELFKKPYSDLIKCGATAVPVISW